MAEFKAGDRVTCIAATTGGGLVNGVTYTVERVETTGSGVKVFIQGARNPDTSGFYGEWRFELAPAPRKDTPKVGDVVRVAVEGEWTGRRVLADYLGHPDVKSIEILKPAKPSVKDLPDRSVIRDTLDVVAVKTGENYWVATNGGVYGDADFDQRGWILLVPQESA